MAGRDEPSADAPGVGTQRSELHEVVAGDARVGRAPGHVILREAFDHVAPERLLEIEDVVGDPEGLRAAARVVEVVGAAA